MVTFSLCFPEPPAQGDLEGALWGFASWPHSSGDHTPLTDTHAHLRVLGSQSTQQPGAAPTSLLTNYPFPTSSDPFSWKYWFCLGGFWSYSTQKEKAVFLTFPRSPLPPSPTSRLPPVLYTVTSSAWVGTGKAIVGGGREQAVFLASNCPSTYLRTRGYTGVSTHWAQSSTCAQRKGRRPTPRGFLGPNPSALQLGAACM